MITFEIKVCQVRNISHTDHGIIYIIKSYY